MATTTGPPPALSGRVTRLTPIRNVRTRIGSLLIFPMMKEQMRIVRLCEQVGLIFDSIRALLSGKTLSGESARFYSTEHKQHFEAKDIQLKTEEDPDSPGKLRLSLNGQNIPGWFRQKYQEVKQATSYYKRPSFKPEEGKTKVLNDNQSWLTDIY